MSKPLNPSAPFGPRTEGSQSILGDALNKVQDGIVPTQYSGGTKPRRSSFWGSGGITRGPICEVSASHDQSITNTYVAPSNKNQWYEQSYYPILQSPLFRNTWFVVTPVPNAYDGSPIKVRIHWRPTGTSGNVVIFNVDSFCIGDNGAFDTNYGTQVQITDTIQTSGNVHHTSEATVTPSGSLAGQQMIFVRVKRDSSSSDKNIFRIMGISLKYPVTGESNA